MKRRIAVAAGLEKADLVLKNGNVFNVFTGDFIKGDIAIVGGKIAGIGSYLGVEEIDVAGKYMTPGFIDAHMHIESTLLSPSEFARAVLPLGTTAVVADPHEIANVCGKDGIKYMLKATENLPLSVFIMLPSCVPSSELENSGATLLAADLAEFMDEPRVLGLGEMMNYPGVLMRLPEVIEKLELAKDRLIDGHAPGVRGKALMAYSAAGIKSDHECVTAVEAQERLSAGMALLIREGSAAKNLNALLPTVNVYNSRFCMFATDDRNTADLLKEGHINNIVRKACRLGLDIRLAIQMATINTAEHFQLKNIGAIAPGYCADILVFDDLIDWQPSLVFCRGKLAAKNGKPLFNKSKEDSSLVLNTVNIAPLAKDKLKIPAKGEKARVIGLIPEQIVTQKLIMKVPQQNGEYVADAAADLLKLAVVERHNKTGNVGVALVHGLGLKEGALASTVAHDSHNLIIVGTNDSDMIFAAEELARCQGGLIAVKDGKVVDKLELPLGGLMSDLDVYAATEKMQQMIEAARSMGVKSEFSPYLTLAFLSLPVIPSLKLTDKGLVDSDRFELVETALE
jgi:adenine deaminase